MARKLSPLQKAYSEFFFAMLDEYEVKSPASLSKEKKTEFFNRIKKEWPKAKRGVKQETREDKVREVIREELMNVLTEGTLKQEIGKQETESQYFVSYLEGMLPELDSPNEKLFYSAKKNIDMAFRQLKNVFKDHQ